MKETPGDVLRLARERLKLSQNALARAWEENYKGVTQSYISKLEHNRIALTVEHVMRMPPEMRREICQAISDRKGDDETPV